MEICHCHGINEHQIRLAVAEGSDSLFKVMERLGAGTGCGGCQSDLRHAIDRARRACDARAQSDCGCSSTSSTMAMSSSVGTSLNTR